MGRVVLTTKVIPALMTTRDKHLGVVLLHLPPILPLCEYMQLQTRLQMYHCLAPSNVEANTTLGSQSQPAAPD